MSSAIQKASTASPEMLNYVWTLVMGSEVAGVSQVTKITPKTVYVVVTEKEWQAPIQALSGKALSELRAALNRPQLSRMVVQLGDADAGKANPPVERTEPVRERPGTRMEPKTLEEPLEIIKEDSLKTILMRLGSKMTWLPLGLFTCLALANCAPVTPAPAEMTDSTAPSNHLVTPSSSSPTQSQATPAISVQAPTGPKRIFLENSYIVQEIKKRKSVGKGDHLTDPRAYYHYLMGLQALQDRDLFLAAEHYKRVVEYDPKTERFFPHLIQLYLRNGQFDEGIAFGLDAVKRYPKNYKLHLYLADMLSAKGKPQQALKHYGKAIELEPKDGRSYLMAGNVLLNLNRDREARDMFEKMVNIAPHNPLGHHYLGKTLIQAHDFENAEKHLKKALDLRPNFLNAREHMAWLLEKKQRYDEALDEYKIILKLNPGNQRIRDYIERTYDDPKAALQQSDQLLEDSELVIKLGTLYYEKSAYFEAMEAFRMALYNNKISADDKIQIRYLISKIYELVGRLDEAIDEMKVLLEGGSDSVEILLQTARLYTMNDQTREAIGLLKRAIELEPQNPRLYHSIALAHMSTGENREAVGYMNRAISINPTEDGYYFELGALQERLGQIDGAIASMKKTIELNPNHSNAHNFLGYLYAEEGVQLNKAQEHLQKALAVQPRNGYFLDSLGWVFYKMGEHQKALVQMKKALVYTPPDPVLYDHLGDIYFELKDFHEARKAWVASKHLMQMKKDDPNAELPDENDLKNKIDKVDRLMKQSF